MASMGTSGWSWSRWSAGPGFVFENKIVGGTIPKEYIPAVEAGVKEALETGVVAGYPVLDLKVTLYDGSYHEVDCSEMAFAVAGSMALKAGVQKAGPILLEPMMKIEVVVPEDFMGDVLGNLSSRRGRIEGMESRGSTQMVRGVRAAGGDVRLCHRSALDDPGAGHLFDGVRSLRAGSGQRSPKGSSPRPGDRSRARACS